MQSCNVKCNNHTVANTSRGLMNNGLRVLPTSRMLNINGAGKYRRHHTSCMTFLKSNCPPIVNRGYDPDSKVLATAEWNASGQSDWYRSGIIKLINMGSSPIKDPKICFTINNGNFSNNYGLTNLQHSGGQWCGNLVNEKSTIIPGGSQDISFGVSYQSATPISSADLPHDFVINGQSVIIDDSEPPSVPENIKLVFTGPQTATLSWNPSYDADTGIKMYNVYYGSDNKKLILATTDTNGITLSGLEPETDYSAYISAVDFADNESAKSGIFSFTTASRPPVNPGNNHIMKTSEFVDATAYPTPSIGSVYPGLNNINHYYLGFIVAGPNGDTANWGGFPSMYNSNTMLSYSADATISDYMKDEILALRRTGGDVSISFGGASGRIIEQTIPDVATITDIYIKIARNYNVKYFDFDIEGAAIADKQAIQKHIQAILAVKAALPDLGISYTLPVDGSPGSLVGFAHDGINLLQSLHDAGIYPDLVNGMAMEFSNPPNGSLYEATVQSIHGMYTAMVDIFGDAWNNDDVMGHIGVCPMFGRNNNGYIFTLDDQRRLVEYATANGVGSLTGWDAVRDVTGQPLTATDQAPGDFGKLISQFNPNTTRRKIQRPAC